MSINEWLAFIACVNEMIGIGFSACCLAGGISMLGYYFRLLCVQSPMCAGFVGLRNLSISATNSSHLCKHDVRYREQPHWTSPNDTAQLMRLGRKCRVSFHFVNVFPSAMGWFWDVWGSIWYRRDFWWQLIQVAQVGTGHVRALRLGSLCIEWWQWVVVGNGTLKKENL